MQSCSFPTCTNNKYKNPFNKETSIVGEDWMRQFFLRHSTTIRKPEATSDPRAMGINRHNVTKIFHLLKELIDNYKLTADRIFKCDETGVSINPKNYCSTSGCINFSRKRWKWNSWNLHFGLWVVHETHIKWMQREFKSHLPPEESAECHETGWITTEIFYELNLSTSRKPERDMRFY